MRIQHNIMAMNAYRNYNNNTKSLSGNLERLSSGYKINRAGDDAAGLAISEKMRAQITGLDAAQKNVKDGISLVKTAEGAMQEVQDMLNRMDYLATQSANGTYDNEVDRANLQKEVEALKSEINRIADSANFNGIKLLDGSWAAEETSTTTGGAQGVSTDLDLLEVAKNKSVDGEKPSDGARATITLSFGAGTGTNAGIDLKAIGDATLSGKAVSELFDIEIRDSKGEVVTGLDFTSTSGTVATQMGGTNAGGTVILTAKNVGAFSSTEWDTLVDTTLATGMGQSAEVEKSANGINVGDAGSGDDTSAIHEYTFKLKDIQGGMQFQAGTVTFEFTNDQNQTSGTYDSDKKVVYITLPTSTATNYQDSDDYVKDLADEIKTAVNGAVGSSGSQTNDFKDVGTLNIKDGTLTLKLKTAEKGKDGNKVHQSTIFDGKTIKYNYTAGNVKEDGDGKGKNATAAYSLDISRLDVGDKITVGGKTVTIVSGEDDDKENYTEGKLSKANLNADNLTSVLNTLGFTNGQVEYDSANKTFKVIKKDADATTAAAWASGGGKVTVTKAPDEDAADAEVTETKGGKALTLQIGDTADKFNQLAVNIGDIHTKAIGAGKATLDGKEIDTVSIEEIDISTQEGAQSAIYSIRNAINQVSSIRGDLGAIQNRLDHTANNLSVMAENIQDAESTIRDTDVANEMMKYTKNNILVQSAQAMLAQANQVPQGVLQLLG